METKKHIRNLQISLTNNMEEVINRRKSFRTSRVSEAQKLTNVVSMIKTAVGKQQMAAIALTHRNKSWRDSGMTKRNKRRK